MTEGLKEKKLRSMNSLGLFDMFKGVTMIGIILGHTVLLFSVNPLPLLGIFGAAPMAAFFMTSGFGFRKCSMKKCIRQQRKMYLVPYFCTGIAATLFHGIMHYSFFHLELKESAVAVAVSESMRILVGFALGLPRTAEFFGYNAFACGLWWFVLSMAIALILLNLILKLTDKKKQWGIVSVTALVGWALCTYCRSFEIPWCLSRAMAILPYTYVGYLAKKKKWLQSSLPKWYIVLVIICVVFSGIFAFVKKSYTDISYGQWSVGPLSIVMDGIIGFFVLWLLMRLGRYDGKVTRFFEIIGAHSFEILCVHTVEWYAPWYLLPPLFEGRIGLGIAVALLIRISFILLGCLLVIFCKKKLIAARKKHNRLT